MVRRAEIQQALLKPGFTNLYPGIPPNEWQPVRVMLDLVRSVEQRRGGPISPDAQLLDPAHFELRGTKSAGSHAADRQARVEARTRRSPTEL
jgi:hypothetical protein